MHCFFLTCCCRLQLQDHPLTMAGITPVAACCWQTGSPASFMPLVRGVTSEVMASRPPPLPIPEIMVNKEVPPVSRVVGFRPHVGRCCVARYVAIVGKSPGTNRPDGSNPHQMGLLSTEIAHQLEIRRQLAAALDMLWHQYSICLGTVAYLHVCYDDLVQQSLITDPGADSAPAAMVDCYSSKANSNIGRAILRAVSAPHGGHTSSPAVAPVTPQLLGETTAADGSTKNDKRPVRTSRFGSDTATVAGTAEGRCSAELDHGYGEAARALPAVVAPKDIAVQQSVEGTTCGVKIDTDQSCCHMADAMDEFWWFGKDRGGSLSGQQCQPVSAEVPSRPPMSEVLKSRRLSWLQRVFGSKSPG
jgi:hypothetical protein